MTKQTNSVAVVKWMEGHPDAVKKTEDLYKKLKGLEFEELEGIALVLMIDVPKHFNNYRLDLITDIINTSSEKALELVLGDNMSSSV